MTATHDAGVTGAEVIYLHEQPEDPEPGPSSQHSPEMAGEVLEGELVTDAEYRALTTQKDKALDRWSGYRRDVVTVARTARTVATHRHTKTAARVTARRAAYVRAGARDRRQQRQAERRQDDMRHARRAAVAAGAIDRVQSLDQQIKDRPKQRADAAAA